MSDAPLMLGVSGLRGIVGQSLTPDVAVRFAGAFAAWLHSRAPGGRRPAVVIGMDGRAGGDVLMHLAAQAMRASGCDVLIASTAMTPSIGFLVDHTGASGGIVVTASHNPQEWNGLKLIIRDRTGAKPPRRGTVAACAPPKETADEIISLYRRGITAWKGPEDPGDYIPRTGPHLPDQHEARVIELLKSSGALRRLKRRRLTVALDTVAGAGAVWAGRFLEAAGCTVRELYPVLKNPKRPGIFPHTPEPTRENLGELCRATKRWKADIGFAIDPDGDRLAIVDERGNYIGEEYTLALAAESLLSARATDLARPRSASARRQPILITNLSTSRMLDDIASRYGARVIRTPVGEANVVQAMKRESALGHDVILGGEGNGGVIWPSVTYIRDSLSAMALVLSLMARTGSTISELASQIPAYSIEKRKVDLARREDAQPAIDRLAEWCRRDAPLDLGAEPCHRDRPCDLGASIAPAPPGKHSVAPPLIDLQDGIRIDFPARRAWLHIRPSNTEPIMRLIAEARNAAEAATLLDVATATIARI